MAFELLLLSFRVMGRNSSTTLLFSQSGMGREKTKRSNYLNLHPPQGLLFVDEVLINWVHKDAELWITIQ